MVKTETKPKKLVLISHIWIPKPKITNFLWVGFGFYVSKIKIPNRNTKNIENIEIPELSKPFLNLIEPFMVTNKAPFDAPHKNTRYDMKHRIK